MNMRMEAGNCKFLASLVVIRIAYFSSFSWKYYWNVLYISYIEKEVKEDVILTEGAPDKLFWIFW